jgi:hypothetical protein
MIFSRDNNFRRVKRFFKDLSGNRWLIVHFVVAIALIVGTSSILQQGQETAYTVDNHFSINTTINYPLIENQQTSKSADTVCILSVLMSLLGQ